MKYSMILASLFFGLSVPAQTTPVSTPQSLIVDSHANVYVTLRYGIARISPDGTVTNLTKPSFRAKIV